MPLHKVLTWLVLACLSVSASARELVLVSMSDTPTKEMKRFQPLADYLAAGLKNQGVTAGRVIIVPDIGAAAIDRFDPAGRLRLDSAAALVHGERLAARTDSHAAHSTGRKPSIDR